MQNIRTMTVALVLCLAGASQAATTTFFGQDLNTSEAYRLTTHANADAARNAFFSHLTGVGTETFEGFAANQSAPITVHFNSDTAQLTGNVSITSLPGTGTTVGRYPISGTKFLEGDSSSNAFNIAFSAPQAAFGFYATDVGDFNGRIRLTLANGGSTVLTVPGAINIEGASVIYFGIIADAADQFTAISFSNSNPIGGDYFGFDDMSIGNIGQVTNPVPVPAAAWMGLSLMAILGGASSLRRRAHVE